MTEVWASMQQRSVMHSGMGTGQLVVWICSNAVSIGAHVHGHAASLKYTGEEVMVAAESALLFVRTAAPNLAY